MRFGYPKAWLSPRLAEVLASARVPEMGLQDQAPAAVQVSPPRPSSPVALADAVAPLALPSHLPSCSASSGLGTQVF